jgi:hypothetical protein
LAAPLAVVVLPEKATSTNFGASKRSVVAHILGADVRLVLVAALAGVVLPDGDTIALEEFSGTHLLGAAATIVLAAPLAGAVLPDKAGLRTVFVARHSSVVALLLEAVVPLVPVAALAGVVLPDGDTIALEEVGGAMLLGTVVPLVPVAALAGVVLPDSDAAITVVYHIRGAQLLVAAAAVIFAASAAPAVLPRSIGNYARIALILQTVGPLASGTQTDAPAIEATMVPAHHPASTIIAVLVMLAHLAATP